MTDPNIPPRDDRPHTTIINNDGPASRGGGGGSGLAFIIGGIVVVLAVIAWFVFSGRTADADRNVDIDVTLPEVNLPEPPANPLPEVPSPAPAEPPAQ
jgi:hypothetical protein